MKNFSSIAVLLGSVKPTIRILTLSVFIGMVGCSYSYKEVYTPINNISSVNTSGRIVVYEKGEMVDREHKIIGALELKDSGATLRCGYYDALMLSKERARELGADAIVIRNIKRPDFVSTCDRLEIDIVEFE